MAKHYPTPDELRGALLVVQITDEIEAAKASVAETTKLLGAAREEIAQLRQESLSAEIKDWIYTLNKLSIGVRFDRQRPRRIGFSRGSIVVSMPLTAMWMHGIQTIIQMFDPIKPSLTDPHNIVDGDDGWQHPNTIADARDVASERGEQAEKAYLARSGVTAE